MIFTLFPLYLTVLGDGEDAGAAPVDDAGAGAGADADAALHVNKNRNLRDV